MYGSNGKKRTPIPGADLNGVVQAMDFLPHNNKAVDDNTKEKPSTPTDKNVVVIGRDTDLTVSVANRHGAKSVTNFEIMPKPADGERMRTLALLAL